MKSNKNYFDYELREKGAMIYLQKKKNNIYLQRYTDRSSVNTFRYDQETSKKDNPKKKKIPALKLSRKNNSFYMMYCFKYYNGQKLDSHRWFLKGFCKTFPPEFIAFLDCGAKPQKDAIFNLFLAMEGDPQVAGVCGYMSLYKQSIMNDESQRVDHEW